MKRLLLFTAALMLVATGWTARGWAQPAPLDFHVSVDERTGEVQAQCGPGCLTRYDDTGKENALLYLCDRRPCRVFIDGTDRFVLDRRPSLR